MKTKGDLSSLRKEFLQSGINKEDLKSSPVEQFSLWFSQAMESDIVEPTAMSLATSDDSIGIRTVLLKYFDEKGFVFYTNYESKKSIQMQKNPQAAILFPWLALERQVKIIGKVEKISKLESLKYFSSRPKGSQIGAWASEQSSRISSRSILIEQFESMKKKFFSMTNQHVFLNKTITFWRVHHRSTHEVSQDDTTYEV